jgi:hypothetical protein
MLAEAIAAALVGMAGLLLVLQPLFRSQHNPPSRPEPLDPEETPRGIALAALKEIDFDRETGKLSEADYEFLKAKYTTVALEALRAEQTGRSTDPVEDVIAARVREVRAPEVNDEPRCRACGPRPEPDALFCSTCGAKLTAVTPTEPATSAGHRAPAPAGIPPSPLQAR